MNHLHTLAAGKTSPRNEEALDAATSQGPGELAQAVSDQSISGALDAKARIATLHAIRDSRVGQTSAAQAARLLEAMHTLGSITTIEASRFLDIYDPPARKLNLVKAGHAILMTWDRDRTESGAVHRIGRYSLVKGAPA